MSKLYIISVGGSLIAPEWPDAAFIKQFRALIVRRVKRGDRFILITGGGAVARHYQSVLRSVAHPSAAELDWMGIYSTRQNAQLLRLAFGPLAYPSVIEDPNKKITFTEKVLVAGGWTPGRSSDYPAVLFAKIYGARTIINLSNIDYVYTKDPRKFKNAKPIKNISWPDFRKLVGTKWSPGKNAPFDPVAAKFAQQNGQKVVIMQGKNLRNLELFLSKKPFTKWAFRGTIVS